MLITCGMFGMEDVSKIFWPAQDEVDFSQFLTEAGKQA